MVPALLTSALVVGASLLRPESAVVERRVGCMGTLLELSVRAEDRPSALRASEAAVRALVETEARLSTWREDSELARLNRVPPGERFPLSEPLGRELALAVRGWHDTEGAFDPAVGAFVRLWGLRRGGRLPEEGELERARAIGGLRSFELGPEGAEWPRYAVRRHAEAELEEGAFGKGAGLDAALAALRAAGAQGASLDLGGQVAVMGSLDEPFRYALADPRERVRGLVAFTIESGSFATTGNSERGIVVDGEARSHVIDPRTGIPAADFGSLTVLAPSATRADLLSTGLYVLGPERALAFAERTPSVEVLVVEYAPDAPEGPEGPTGLRVRASGGWDLDPLVDGLEIEVFRSTVPFTGGAEGSSLPADRPAAR